MLGAPTAGPLRSSPGPRGQWTQAARRLAYLCALSTPQSSSLHGVPAGCRGQGIAGTDPLSGTDVQTQQDNTMTLWCSVNQRDSHFPPEHSPCSACLRETWLLRPGTRPGAWGASCHPPQCLATTGPGRPSKVQVLAGGTVPGTVTYRGPQQRPPPSFSSLPLGDGPEKILKESPLYPHFPNW